VVDSERTNTMKSSVRSQAEGNVREAKGLVREVIGKFTNNPRLEAEGKGERLAGKMQEMIGRTKNIAGKQQ
jgi:uncharacterized protein YjbJ (UPF0337 family)